MVRSNINTHPWPHFRDHHLVAFLFLHIFRKRRIALERVGKVGGTTIRRSPLLAPSFLAATCWKNCARTLPGGQACARPRSLLTLPAREFSRLFSRSVWFLVETARPFMRPPSCRLQSVRIAVLPLFACACRPHSEHISGAIRRGLVFSLSRLRDRARPSPLSSH